MKTMTKILVAALVITSIIPFMMSMLCLFNHEAALQFFVMTSLNADLQQAFLLLGGFALTFTVFPMMAVIWLSSGKREGLILSYVVSAVYLFRGALMFVTFSTYGMKSYTIPFVAMGIGILLLLLSLMSSREITRPAEA